MSGNGAVPAKRRFAFYGAASCGGCDIAVLNLHDAILDFVGDYDIVFWPTVVDTKYADVERMEDGSIDLALFSGGIRTRENAELARLLRKKAATLVAFGSCATEGCIPGLANLAPTGTLLDVVFEGPSTENPDHVRPLAQTSVDGDGLELPALEPMLRTLDQVVEIDYRMPGCPPESDRIAEVIGLVTAALEGKAELPPRGSVIGAGHSTVCDECRRDRNAKRLAAFHRIQELPPLDPGLCLLEQGVPCNGPATRDGCGAKCPLAGAPCIGCYGPADGVTDFGASLLSAFASVVDASEAPEIDAILDGLPDPVGQFYRFSLAGSLLRGARAAHAVRSPVEETKP